MPKVKSITESLAHSFEERISTGTWGVGQILPTEAQLADEFSCSRGTISKAMDRLRQQGLVERKTGIGTRVITNKRLPTPPNQSLQLDACAIVIPNEALKHIWSIVQGFQHAAQQVNRRTVLLSVGANFRKEAEIIGRLGEFDVKGAVLYPVINSPQEVIYFSQMILACPYPVVIANISLPSLGLPSSVCDHFHGGFTLTNHFIAQGLRRIGFFTSNSWQTGPRERYQGFRVAMEQAGLAVDPRALLLHPTMKVDFDDPVAEGALLAKQLLLKAPDLDAVVCEHDLLALGCLKAAKELGIDVPSRLKIGTIGSANLPAGCDRLLTSYSIDYSRIGQEAFGLLQRCLTGENLGAEEIKIRGSINEGTSLLSESDTFAT